VPSYGFSNSIYDIPEAIANPFFEFYDLSPILALPSVQRLNWAFAFNPSNAFYYKELVAPWHTHSFKTYIADLIVFSGKPVLSIPSSFTFSYSRHSSPMVVPPEILEAFPNIDMEYPGLLEYYICLLTQLVDNLCFHYTTLFLINSFSIKNLSYYLTEMSNIRLYGFILYTKDGLSILILSILLLSVVIYAALKISNLKKNKI